MHATIPPLLVQKLAHFPASNQLPRYMTEGAAAMDVQSAIRTTLYPHDNIAVPTGLAFAVPEGYEMQVRSRSGLAAKFGVFVTNGIGTIDSDYRGEVMVLLSHHGHEALEINVGDRIAQLVLALAYRPSLVREVSALPGTARGIGGLGSTGR